MNTIKEKIFKNNPTRMIVFGFLVVIATGTMLLCLPVSSQNGQSINVLDALFTATSATCVTGLTNRRFRIYDIYCIRFFSSAQKNHIIGQAFN